MSNDHTPPHPGVGDKAHTAARAALQVIPFIGGPAAELFTAIVQPPLTRRQQEWREFVGQELDRLQKAGSISFEELSADPVFLDVVMQASQAALRTSHEEKRLALRNAISNSTRADRPEQALLSMFVQMVDRFTEWHLRLLKLFDDPEKWFQANNRRIPGMTMGSLVSVLEAAFPDLQGRRPLYDLIWTELHSCSLVTTDNLHGGMTAAGLRSSRTSELGKEFLALVTGP